jgi:hypothetical protein
LKSKYEAQAVQLQHLQRTRSKNSFAQSAERGVPRLAPPSNSLGGLETFPEESSDFGDSDNESNAGYSSGVEMPSSNYRSRGLSQRDYDHIQELEIANEELSSQLDNLLSESQESEKTYKAKIRRLESEFQGSQDMYAAAIEKIELLEQDNQRLIKKQSEDFWNLKYNRTTCENDNDDIIARLQQKVADLDKSNHLLERTKAEIEKNLKRTVKEMEAVRMKYTEVLQESKDFKELQAKYEEQSEHIAELSMSLEEQREINTSMRSGFRSGIHSRAGSFSENALRRLSDPDAMNALRGVTSTVGNKNPRRTLLDELESEFYRDLAMFQRDRKKGKNGTPPFSPVMSESDLSEYARSVGMSEAEEDILSAVDYMSDDEFQFLDEFKEDDEKAMRRREWFFRRWARAIIRFLRSIWRWCRFLVLLCAAVLMALYRGPDDVLPGEM